MAVTPSDIRSSLDNREVQLPAYTGAPLADRQVKKAASSNVLNQTRLKRDTLAARTPSHFQALVERLAKLEKRNLVALLAAKDRNGNTPLHFATRGSACLQPLQPFLDTLESRDLIVLLAAKDRNGNTPLHFATRGSARLMLLQPILDKLEHKDRNQLMESENKAGITPRDHKTELGYETEAGISKGAFYQLKREALAARSFSDFQALEEGLAKLGNHNLIALLADKDSYGKTPLHFAAKNPACLKLLKPFLDTLEPDDRRRLMKLKSRCGKTPHDYDVKGIMPHDNEVKGITPDGILPALHDEAEAGHFDNDILSNITCEMSATAYDDIFEPFDLSNFSQVNRLLHQEPPSPLSIQASSADQSFGNNTNSPIEYWRSSSPFKDMADDEEYLKVDWDINS